MAHGVTPEPPARSEQMDWARWLLGACSSGDPLRHAVVRNYEQTRELTGLRARDEAAKAVVRAWGTTEVPGKGGKRFADLLDALARAHEDGGTER